MMNNEIKTRIEQIERELLIMEYKEHWTYKDYARRDELNAELRKLTN